MLRIYCNTSSEAKDVTTWIKLSGMSLSVRVRDTQAEIEKAGEHVIEELLPYNSYGFIEPTGAKQVKAYKRVYQSPYRFIDYNRMGVATKLDFMNMMSLYAQRNFLQVDTGMMAAEQRDVIIRVFIGNKDKIFVESDLDFEILDFDSEKLQSTEYHPRNTLWDSYALIVNGYEYQANKKGLPVGGNGWGIPIKCDTGCQNIAIGIQKYKGAFEHPLNRDYDDEEVFIESSVGILDARRVRLENGHGVFHLFPLGYTGEFKLKLGRKWYTVWNDYTLELGES